MDGPYEKMAPRESTIQRIDKKTSSLSMLAGTIAFAIFAGMRMDTALESFTHATTQYRWPIEFAMSVAFVVVAFRWGLSLLKRARLNEGERA